MTHLEATTSPWRGAILRGVPAGRELNPANTILDGGGTGRVLYLYDGAYVRVRVEGFTIQNGNAPDDGYGGGGVYAASSGSHEAGDVIIKGNIITGNDSTGYGGGVDAASYGIRGPEVLSIPK